MTASSEVGSSESERYQLNASWLLKLRWVAVVGQILTIAAVDWFFGIKIPMVNAVAGIILLTIVSNLALTVLFAYWQRHSESRTMPWNLVLGLILIMDLLSLAALLYMTGGPNNPFSLFFFVNLCLCALLLDRNWTFAINVLTVLCFAGLMVNHQALPGLDLGLRPFRELETITLQHWGMLMAFTTCSCVIVSFMTRLTGELRRQQAAIAEAQAIQAHSEKVEALGTLAAGAAHELATPLSTIAVVARDVEKAIETELAGVPELQELIDDVHLIRSQLDRCRGIIDRMAGHAGETAGEPFNNISMQQLAEKTIGGLLEQDRIRLALPPSAANESVRVPVEGLSQALRCLLQNAIDADVDGHPVDVAIAKSRTGWRWEVRDCGTGMSAEELKRVSQPFFTTKPPGKGMGLGVFLAQNVLTRLGGSLKFESEKGQGTCVTIDLPSR